MWLVGMMGSGKTSIGKLVADAVDTRFFDTDDAVVTLAGRTVTELWDDIGETGFRELERAAIGAIPRGVVAAAGGGAVLDAVNREVMRLDPPVVWLRAAPETLAIRLGGVTDRPLLGASAESQVELLREILNARTASYVAAATHTVETDGRELEDLVSEVIELWPV
jgi:shikimate kinase